MGRPATPLAERFWSKVDVRGDGECWPWLAGTFTGKPYGQFTVQAGEAGRERSGPVRSHRLAFFLIQGRWPEPCGLHGCDNPPCCNAVSPEHVHEGDQALNAWERESRGRGGGPQLVLLAAWEIPELRRRYAAGATYKTLAAERDVSLSTVWRAVQGISPYGGVA
jgi:hypothetical protein